MLLEVPISRKKILHKLEIKIKTNMYYYLPRKARCLLALKQNKSALDNLKQTLVALDDAKLPLDRRMKWQKDVQIMITMMLKNKLQDGNTMRK